MKNSMQKTQAGSGRVAASNQKRGAGPKPKMDNGGRDQKSGGTKAKGSI